MNLRNLFFHTVWNVGVTTCSPESLLAGENPAVRRLSHPREHCWLADPFVLEHEGKTYLLCEEMDVRLNRGRIVCLDLSEESPVPIPALERPYHLSYPFVFTHKGHAYVVPEMFQARKVTLFHVVGSPPRLEEAAVLLEDVAAVDPTVVYHDGSWWLFHTDADNDDNAELHLWFADDLRGPWRRHPGNPVKRDRASARPAGTPFIVDGALYRPAQDCSREYGGAIALNRVLVLDRTRFAEETVARIEPDPHRPSSKGLHTLSVGPTLNALDEKSERFNLLETLRTLGL